jgi:hypothetical protein
MKERRVTVPELAMIGATRGMLGAGIGLLAAGRLNGDQRRTAGFLLLAIGIASTIPLAIEVFGRESPSRPALAS